MTTLDWSVADLRTAYRHSTTPEATPTSPTERAGVSVRIGGCVGVLGISGGVGSSTVALALAEALPAARLVELASPHSSGLAGAAEAELGTRDGWGLGRRGTLRLERRLTAGARFTAEVGELTVVDLGTWNPAVPAPAGDVLVAVSRCSIPGVRRLEACLEMLGPGVAPVITRTPGGRLPKQVAAAAGPLVRAALVGGSLAVVPESRGLAVAGVTSDRLPAEVCRAVAGVASMVKEESR